MSEGLFMANRDIDRLRTIHDVLHGKLSQVEAADTLHLTDRQVRRLCGRVHDEGNRGIIHKLRGRPSNHQLDGELLGKALSALHHPKWEGFGPTYAADKLDEYYAIVLSPWTVRRLMLLTELWRTRRPRPQHRSWRPRRARVGMLVQLDGSPHDWFEGRGPRCVLLIFIDDATSRILWGEFVPVESTDTLMRAVRAFLRRYGRPVAFYVDKGSIYKVNRQAAVEEQLNDADPVTQFTRAMHELGIEVIFANSPQAKGRVERGFRTHQDRLIKDFRLQNICTIEAANRFLRDEYIPDHNARCAVEPAEAADAHRPLLPTHDLDAILSHQEDRNIQDDYTVRYGNRFFQLEEGQSIRRKTDVTIQERLDGSLHIVYKGRYLDFHQVPGRPYRPEQVRRARRAAVAAILPRTRRRPDPFFATFSLASSEPTMPPASAGVA